MSLDLRLCDRCGVDAKAFDSEHRPLLFAEVSHFTFCRRCAELLKRRLEKAAQGS